MNSNHPKTDTPLDRQVLERFFHTSAVYLGLAADGGAVAHAMAPFPGERSVAARSRPSAKAFRGRPPLRLTRPWRRSPPALAGVAAALQIREARRSPRWRRDVAVAALGLVVVFAPLPPAAEAAEPLGVAPAPVARRLVDQKHVLVAHLVSGSPLAKRVDASEDGEARGHLAAAREALVRAEAALAAGDLAAADREFTAALGSLRTAGQRVPAPTADRQAEKMHFAHLLSSVQALRAGYQGLLAGPTSARPATTTADPAAPAQEADALIAAAQALGREGRYPEAGQRLQHAQALLLSAYRQNLADPTVVYQRRFAQPEQQFDHELARTRGYYALVPVAIQKLQPGARAIGAIEVQVARAKDLESRAREQAARGDWKAGLASLDDATAVLERALEIAGIGRTGE